MQAEEAENQRQFEERMSGNNDEENLFLDTAEVRLASGSTYLTTSKLAIQLGLPMLRYESRHSSTSVTQQSIKSDWHNLFSQPKPVRIDPVADQRAVDSLTVISSAVTASRKDLLTGFLGISWGTNQESVKSAILNRRDNAQLGGQNHDSIWFYQGWFGDFAYSRMTLRFVDNKLYSGEVDFKIPYSQDSANDSSITIFESIRDEIINKHGEPTDDIPAVS
ncbi:MAG TPA: hypothetical protein VFD13_08900, partial [Candidatus Kapabacteria bacterium]|nr:hypothetical protein [Candidatus Kapabacteria bacterium]